MSYLTMSLKNRIHFMTFGETTENHGKRETGQSTIKGTTGTIAREPAGVADGVGQEMIGLNIKRKIDRADRAGGREKKKRCSTNLRLQ